MNNKETGEYVNISLLAWIEYEGLKLTSIL